MCSQKNQHWNGKISASRKGSSELVGTTRLQTSLDWISESQRKRKRKVRLKQNRCHSINGRDMKRLLKKYILFAGSPWQRLRSMLHNIPGLACQDDLVPGRFGAILWLSPANTPSLGHSSLGFHTWIRLPESSWPRLSKYVKITSDIGQDYNPQLQEKYQRFSRNNQFQRYTKGLEKLFL